ncbi:MAG: hypothetical protein KIY12_00275 [Thermoplasmata archaeon]|uniref:Phosphotyrosine protein phosphatase I domain-containing protein n=1 Tax=Candidatus Sysuiplasma superficiale TaxID=2823368 RepID=A0A8J7YUI4_9ARCH|nr:hypothetical protein [Candidatus Sysuiplasma superficiale]MBX8643159.1 hypothetical protein [Candidatus Sysuiplasma superficiale]MCL4346522.1 hypothetical protein [Candidatus Thermoplasmatota archaeon]
MAENIVRRLVFGKPVRSILVVGTTNTNASALMEFLLKAEGEGKEMKFSSAGLSASDGSPMDARASSFLMAAGIDASGFRSRKLTDAMAGNFELMLCTSMAVKGFLLFLYPEATIYTLSEYALIGSDVSGMEGMPEDEYRQAAEELREMAKRIIARATKNTTF